MVPINRHPGNSNETSGFQQHGDKPVCQKSVADEHLQSNAYYELENKNENPMQRESTLPELYRNLGTNQPVNMCYDASLQLCQSETALPENATNDETSRSLQHLDTSVRQKTQELNQKHSKLKSFQNILKKPIRLIQTGLKKVGLKTKKPRDRLHGHKDRCSQTENTDKENKVFSSKKPIDSEHLRGQRALPSNDRKEKVSCFLQHVEKPVYEKTVEDERVQSNAYAELEMENQDLIQSCSTMAEVRTNRKPIQTGNACHACHASPYSYVTLKLLYPTTPQITIHQVSCNTYKTECPN